MRVGFLVNQIDNRGTGNSTFEYARYNRDLLGNESTIFTYANQQHSMDMLNRYGDEFHGIIVIPGPEYVQQIDNIDVLYHIKYGYDDGIKTSPSVRYAVHSVFSNEPHGERYAVVSDWLGQGKTPVVPHIINLPPVQDNLREEYDISKTAVVFGRYGATDTFDIPWVWNVIETILERYTSTWFLFANTTKVIEHPRIIYHKELVTDEQKSTFIGTTDYMLHARQRGETFGISVGEFASKGRPVVTYLDSPEKAHLDYLTRSVKNDRLFYSDNYQLYQILARLAHSYTPKTQFAYTEFTPQIVMERFRDVFLS